MPPPELPPLPRAPLAVIKSDAKTREYVGKLESVTQARERILQARIAEQDETLRHLGSACDKFRLRIAELEADAARYRYLRKAHWSDSPLCVVTIPKKNTILGADLPSGDRLDAAIDAAREGK